MFQIILNALKSFISPFLLAFGPMLKDLFFKILLALGFSFVSYSFIFLVVDQLLSYVSSEYFLIDQVVLDVLNLAGFGEALNILFGAFNLCIGLFSAGKSIRFFSSK